VFFVHSALKLICNHLADQLNFWGFAPGSPLDIQRRGKEGLRGKGMGREEERTGEEGREGKGPTCVQDGLTD
jgi:hypothetical protein